MIAYKAQWILYRILYHNLTFDESLRKSACMQTCHQVSTFPHRHASLRSGIVTECRPPAGHLDAAYSGMHKVGVSHEESGFWFDFL